MHTDKMYVVSVWHWRVRSVADIRCVFSFFVVVGLFFLFFLLVLLFLSVCFLLSCSK